MTEPYKLHGALASPYSLKMRALLRYRRIPFIWVQDMAARQALFAKVKAPVIPLLEYPDGHVANDSTPLIHDLEQRHAGRHAVPQDPGAAFLAFLIEDFADEWMTKAMFQYRWLRERDQQQMSRWIIFDAMPGVGAEAQAAAAQQFRNRQVGRMGLVGCTPGNDPLITASTRRLLEILEAHLPNGLFLFGTRPSHAEFALYGQLSQLAVDPTPQDLLRNNFPLAYRWLAHVEDLSGIDGAWGPPGAMVEPLLALIGEVYLPFLSANAAAIDAEAPELRFRAMGHAYAQPPFRYQLKCLAALRQAHAALPAAARAAVDPLLARTGCLEPLKG